MSGEPVPRAPESAAQLSPARIRRFRADLVAWYRENARDLPWRRTRDPYAIWLSEIMLQQTRVAAVIEHYHLFLRRYPTIESLAAATEAEVIALWSGLGYYRRPRMLLRAAQFVVRERGGQLPSTAAELRTLPGIGEYTSAAIASIAFGEPVASIDGNVERVVTRICGVSPQEPVKRAATRLRNLAAALLDQQNPGDFNQAMMELGATVCVPQNPLCGECPVAAACRTRGEHAVAPRPKMRSAQVAYAFLRRKGRIRGSIEVLLEQRADSESLMPGMWELPPLAAPTGCHPGDRLLNLRHSITNTNFYVTVCSLVPADQDLLSVTGQQRVWVRSTELGELPLTGLARKILKRLRIMPGYTGPGPSVNFEDSPVEMFL